MLVAKIKCAKTCSSYLVHNFIIFCLLVANTDCGGWDIHPYWRSNNSDKDDAHWF